MEVRSKPRGRLWVLAGISHMAPVVAGALAWHWLSTIELDSSTQVILVLGIASLTAGIAFGWWYHRLGRPIQAITRHISALTDQNYAYRSNPHLKLGQMIPLLNSLSDQLQTLVSRSQSELGTLTAKTRQLSNIINDLSLGIVAIDASNHIVLANKTASVITGLSEANMLKQPLSQVLPLIKGNALVVNDWLTTIAGTDLARQSWDNVALANQSGRSGSLTVEAIYQGTDSDGIRCLVMFRTRSAAQEEEDRKIDFVALAAHELRSPITVIRGYLEILDNELGGQLVPEHKQIIQKLALAAGQLSGFINNILHVARIEHGELNFNLEPTDWIELVKGASLESIKRAALEGQQLILKLPDKLPPVVVDKTSMTEVLTNLLDNAIKYGASGQTITLSVHLVNNQIETVVEDQGVGIPANAIDKLFTKFYRSHRTKTSHYGTGLGLFMCKAIVEALGGTVWVRSTEGHGSTFGFLLPVYDKLNDRRALSEPTNRIIRGVHGWIKNHSLYRG